MNTRRCENISRLLKPPGIRVRNAVVVANSINGYETAFRRYRDQAARTAVQISGAVLPITLSLTNANWRFLIRCMSSIPAIVIDAH
jgi:hypothetical protein